MKKTELKRGIMGRIAAMLLVCALMACLTACGGGGSSAAGTYKLEEFSGGGINIKAADMETFGMTGTLVLNEDGTGKMDIAGTAQELTWKGNTITAENESIDFTLSGGLLTLEQDGSKMVFKKQ